MIESSRHLSPQFITGRDVRFTRSLTQSNATEVVLGIQGVEAGNQEEGLGILEVVAQEQNLEGNLEGGHLVACLGEGGIQEEGRRQAGPLVGSQGEEPFQVVVPYREEGEILRVAFRGVELLQEGALLDHKVLVQLQL